MDKLKVQTHSKWIATPHIQEQIDSKIAHMMTYENEIPGITVIHNLRDFTVLYITEPGLKILKINLKEIQDLGLDYYKKYFSPDSYAYSFAQAFNLI